VSAPPDPTISGHPEVVLPNADDNPVTITVCAGCGEMRTILFLSGDRWFCTKCRAEGDARPTMIPIAWNKGG
jgi:hypothetical protein